MEPDREEKTELWELDPLEDLLIEVRFFAQEAKSYKNSVIGEQHKCRGNEYRPGAVYGKLAKAFIF